MKLQMILFWDPQKSHILTLFNELWNCMRRKTNLLTIMVQTGLGEIQHGTVNFVVLGPGDCKKWDWIISLKNRQGCWLHVRSTVLCTSPRVVEFEQERTAAIFNKTQTQTLVLCCRSYFIWLPLRSRRNSLLPSKGVWSHFRWHNFVSNKGRSNHTN